MGSFVSLEARPVVPVKQSLFARIFGTKVPAAGVEPTSSTDPAGLTSVDMGDAVLADAAVPPNFNGTTKTTPAAVEVPTIDVSASNLNTRGAEAPVERLALEIAQGERLSVALERLLRSRGWTLVWRASIDLEAATAARVEGNSIAEILGQVLPQLDLAADLYNPSRTVVIRNTQETASQGAS
jgi:hypothetical protein